jgi:hypothetical protein
MSRIALVSGCDANYYPMLVELIHSIRRFPQGRDMDICILDAGLTPEQRNNLSGKVKTIVNPDWPKGVPAHKIRGREYLKGCICRPFIPDMFPGYETYIWMDADTWVQDWRAIDLYLEGAKCGKLTITAQADRAYTRQIRIKWLGAMPLKIRGFYYSNALKAFGFKMAKQILPFQVLNAGAFSLPGNAPHWARWQELAVKATKKGKVFTAEQLSLGIMTYLEHYPVEILPAWTQWLCTNKPLWDDKKLLFVEPFLPHETLGIVHLSGLDDMRVDRSVKTSFEILNSKNGTAEMSYRYPYFDGEKNIEIP